MRLDFSFLNNNDANPTRSENGMSDPPGAPAPAAKPSPSEAAYLQVKPELAEDLESPEELLAALTLAGYNPTRAALDRHWEAAGRRKVSFGQFDHIVATEPLPRRIDLMSYFR